MTLQKNKGGKTNVPAEWAPHERCVMAFCAAKDMYSSSQLEGIQYEQIGLAQTISKFEPVTMLTNQADAELVTKLCGDQVDVRMMEHYDIWTRDTLPTFGLGDGGLRSAIVWNFNIWGEKFEDYEADRDLAMRFARENADDVLVANLVSEGGALEFDGDGTVLTTKSALLNPNRNPDRSVAEIEQELSDLTGAAKIIWLPGEESGITDGHIDGFARFIRPGTVVAEVSDDPYDPEYDALMENAEGLIGQKDAQGRPLNVIRIRRPRWEILGECGDNYTPSYVNFYFANNAVILPKFDDPLRDVEVFETFSREMPDREIVQVYVDEICEAGGGLHCAIQHIPQGAT